VQGEAMMIRKTLRSLSLFVAVVSASAAVNAQSNLLRNPDADQGEQSWRAFGDSEIETTTTKDTYFVVRNGGYFLQDVEFPKDAAGKYIVFIGRGASERVNPDGAITGLPYLYGYMMQPPAAGKNEILSYLQGQQMLAQTSVRDDWVTMWGIFEVPEGTTKVRFFLNQALRAGVPHNGSAARFDHLGLYLFATRKEAQAFVREYQ
jgi:hypothetical protein